MEEKLKYNKKIYLYILNHIYNILKYIEKKKILYSSRKKYIRNFWSFIDIIYRQKRYDFTMRISPFWFHIDFIQEIQRI